MLEKAADPVAVLALQRLARRLCDGCAEPDAPDPAALARIGELMSAEPGTPEGEELDVLVDLVEHYEEKHVPFGFPSPVAAIEFRLEQAGLTPRHLIPLIGSRARVSEVLSGKRPLLPHASRDHWRQMPE